MAQVKVAADVARAAGHVRAGGAEHLLPHDGDRRPLRLHEGGIPDGYFPIDINTHMEDPEVKLCRLDFKAYTANPSRIPMFKDLLRRSVCSGAHVMTKRLSDLKVADEVVAPTGFVFHQSRCGSTLTANLLGADPLNLVFSESNPPAAVALHCSHCSEAQKIEYLRAVVRGMGNSHRHRRLFFKFQSANTPMIELYAKAFPEVPWIYIYRDPVEILASHLKDGAHNRNAPCLRRTYAAAITDMLQRKKQNVNSPPAYCAAYLAHLNNGALTALREAGSRGLPVRYTDIPHVMLDKVFPRHFGYTPSQHVRSRMMDQASKYSKDRSGSRTWNAGGDSQDKQQRASVEMKVAAREVLLESFTALNTIRGEVLARLQSVAVADHNQDAARARKDADVAAAAAAKADNAEAAAAAEAAIGVGDGGEEPINPGGAVLLPATVPPPGKYLPPGEPFLDSAGKYVPLAHRDVGRRDNYGGINGRPAYEETVKDYLPYPELVPLPALLSRWPPDNPDIPNISGIAHGSLEVFDYKNVTQRARADLLRYNEVPFKMYNVPSVDETVKKWKQDAYLIRKFGPGKQRVTSSNTNHFMYFRKRRGHQAPKDYKPPTGTVMLSFEEWLERAQEAESKDVETPHYYFQLNSVGDKRWILDDVTDFRPVPSLFIADPKANRGINCRFGARGIIAEAHYDGGRNFITILRGAKRYILLPPSECPLLYLWPKQHPEGRHAKADWSKLDLQQYPEMAKARATEVVIREGEVLYVPSYWFHYIISTTVTAQCNSRSGNSIRGRDLLRECGFY